MADDVNPLLSETIARKNWKFSDGVRNAIYSPALNCIIATVDGGFFEVLDIHSGEILTRVKHRGAKAVSIQYIEESDKLVVHDDNRIGCRGVHRECVLLESILQVGSKRGAEGAVNIELDLVQAGVLINGFQSCQASLQTSEFSEIVPKSKAVLEALEASYEFAVKQVKDVSNVAVQWVMVSIEMDLQLLYSVFNNLLFVLKWKCPGPALPIVGEVLYRILKLQGSKRDSTLNEKSLMFSEVERLETFAVWPHKDYRWALPQPMAEAGFYHPFDSQGAEDRVMCFTCTVCLVCWEPSDQPWSEHERHSSSCPFVKKNFTENVTTSVCSATDCAQTVGSSTEKIISMATTADGIISLIDKNGVVTVYSSVPVLKTVKRFTISLEDIESAGIVPFHMDDNASTDDTHSTIVSAEDSTVSSSENLTAEKEEPPAVVVRRRHLRNANQTLPFNITCSACVEVPRVDNKGTKRYFLLLGITFRQRKFIVVYRFVNDLGAKDVKTTATKAKPCKHTAFDVNCDDCLLDGFTQPEGFSQADKEGMSIIDEYLMAGISGSSIATDGVAEVEKDLQDKSFYQCIELPHTGGSGSSRVDTILYSKSHNTCAAVCSYVSTDADGFEHLDVNQSSSAVFIYQLNKDGLAILPVDKHFTEDCVSDAIMIASNAAPRQLTSTGHVESNKPAACDVIAVLTENGTVHLLRADNLATLQSIVLLPQPQTLATLLYCPDLGRFVACCNDGAVVVYDFDSNASADSIPQQKMKPLPDVFEKGGISEVMNYLKYSPMPRGLHVFAPVNWGVGPVMDRATSNGSPTRITHQYQAVRTTLVGDNLRHNIGSFKESDNDCVQFQISATSETYVGYLSVALTLNCKLLPNEDIAIKLYSMQHGPTSESHNSVPPGFLLCGPLNLSTCIDDLGLTATVVFTASQLISTKVAHLVLELEAVPAAANSSVSSCNKDTAHQSAVSKIVSVVFSMYQFATAERYMSDHNAVVQSLCHSDMLLHKVLERLNCSYEPRLTVLEVWHSLEFLIWLCQIKMWLSDEERDSFLIAIAKDVSAMVKHCLLRAERSSAHRFAQLVCSVFRFPSSTAKSSLMVALKEAVLDALDSPHQASSAASIRWLFFVFNIISSPDDAPDAMILFQRRLIRLAELYHSSLLSHHKHLQERFGISANLLDPLIVEPLSLQIPIGDDTRLQSKSGTAKKKADKLTGIEWLSLSAADVSGLLEVKCLEMQVKCTSEVAHVEQLCDEPVLGQWGEIVVSPDGDVAAGPGVAAAKPPPLKPPPPKQPVPYEHPIPSIDDGVSFPVLDAHVQKMMMMGFEPLSNSYSSQTAKPKGQTSQSSSQDNHAFDNDLGSAPTTQRRQLCLIVERMHVASHHSVVVEFPKTVQITDIFIPRCMVLSRITVLAWQQHQNESDAEVITTSTLIASRALVVQDSLPAIQCKFVKIVVVGNHRQATSKAVISLGQFYGHIVNDTTDKGHTVKQFNDTFWKYCQASRRLLVLMDEEPGPQLMQTRYQKEVVATCQDISTIQVLLNSGDAINKTTGPTRPSTSGSLEHVCHDKVRLLTECVLETLVLLSHQQEQRTSHTVNSQEITEEVCLEIFQKLCIYGPLPLARTTCVALNTMCRTQAWWPSFLAKAFAACFCEASTSMVLSSRTFYVYMTLIHLSLPQPGVISSLFVSLSEIISNITEHPMSLPNRQYLDWLLLILNELLNFADQDDWTFVTSWKSICPKLLTDRVNSRAQSMLQQELFKKHKPSSTIDKSTWTSVSGLASKGKEGLLEYLKNEGLPSLMKMFDGGSVKAKDGTAQKVSSPTPPRSIREVEDGNLREEPDIAPVAVELCLDQDTVVGVAKMLFAAILGSRDDFQIGRTLLACKTVALLPRACSKAISLDAVLSEEQLYQLMTLPYDVPSTYRKWMSYAVICILRCYFDREKVTADHGALEYAGTQFESVPGCSTSAGENSAEPTSCSNGESTPVQEASASGNPLSWEKITAYLHEKTYNKVKEALAFSYKPAFNLHRVSQFGRDNIYKSVERDVISLSSAHKKMIWSNSSVFITYPDQVQENIPSDGAVAMLDACFRRLLLGVQTSDQGIDIFMRYLHAMPSTVKVGFDGSGSGMDCPLGIANLLTSDGDTRDKWYYWHLLLSWQLRASHRQAPHPRDFESMRMFSEWMAQADCGPSSNDACSTQLLLNYASRVDLSSSEQASQLRMSLKTLFLAEIKSANRLLGKSQNATHWSACSSVAMTLCSREASDSCSCGDELALTCGVIDAAVAFVSRLISANANVLQEEILLGGSSSRAFIIDRGNVLDQSESILQSSLALLLETVLKWLNASLRNESSSDSDLPTAKTVADLYDTKASFQHLVAALNIYSIAFDTLADDELVDDVEADSHQVASHRKTHTLLVDVLTTLIKHGGGVVLFFEAVLQFYFPASSNARLKPLSSAVKKLLLTQLRDSNDVDTFLQCGFVRSICSRALLPECVPSPLHRNSSSIVGYELSRWQQALCEVMIDGERTVKSNRRSDGLLNFSPFSSISGPANADPGGDPLDVLLKSKTPHRRIRFAAFTHKVAADADPWIMLDIDLPCAVLVKEIAIVMHQSYIGGCPSKVKVELAEDGETFVPFSPALSTSGRALIRIILAKAEVAKTVRLHLRAPVDLSFKLNLIEVYGNTVFPMEDSPVLPVVNRTCVEWIDVLSAASDISSTVLVDVRRHLGDSNVMLSMKAILSACTSGQRWLALSFYVDVLSSPASELQRLPLSYDVLFPDSTGTRLCCDEVLSPSLLQEFLITHIEADSFVADDAKRLVQFINGWFNGVLCRLAQFGGDNASTVQYLDGISKVLRTIKSSHDDGRSSYDISVGFTTLDDLRNTLTINSPVIACIGTVLNDLSHFRVDLIHDVISQVDSKHPVVLLIVAHSCWLHANVDHLFRSNVPHKLCQEVIDICTMSNGDWLDAATYMRLLVCLKSLTAMCHSLHFVTHFGADGITRELWRTVMFFLDNVDVYRLHSLSELFLGQFFVLQDVAIHLLQHSVGRCKANESAFCRELIDLMQAQIQCGSATTQGHKTFLEEVALQLIIKEKTISVTLVPRPPALRGNGNYACARLKSIARETLTVSTLQRAILPKRSERQCSNTAEEADTMPPAAAIDPALLGSDYYLYASGIAGLEKRKKQTDGKKTADGKDQATRQPSFSALCYCPDATSQPLHHAMPLYQLIDMIGDKQLPTDRLNLEYEVIQWQGGSAGDLETCMPDVSPPGGLSTAAASSESDRRTLLEVFTRQGGLHLMALNYRSSCDGNDSKRMCADSVAIIGHLLSLPGYGNELLKYRKEAEFILRLMLNVEETAKGEKIACSKVASDLLVVPYLVLNSLLQSTPLSSEQGRELRHVAFKEGVFDLILEKLTLLTSDSPQIMPEFPGGSTSKAFHSQDYWAKGTGFGTGSTMSNWNVEKLNLKKKREEERGVALLSVVASFINPLDELLLWRSSDGLAFDLPDALVEACLTSCLRETLAAYLRNDSVLDMARHVPLYRAVMSVLKAIVSLPSLVPMVMPDASLGPLASNTSALSFLLTKMKRCADTYSSRLKAGSSKPKLATRRIKGSRKLLNPSSSSTLSSGSFNELDESEAEQLSLLIKDIDVTLSAVLEKVADYKSLATKPVECEGKGKQNTEEQPTTSDEQRKNQEADYVAQIKELQFDTFEIVSEDSEGKLKFATPYHYQQIVRAAKSEGSAARARRIAQEVASLSTSLPLSFGSTVFLRCDENRLDVMKVLITGPEDTPYANGCFEFDVYFPVDYPTSPMMVNLQTTGQHSVRFNPNLYNDGKVCLSILNTWHGRPEEKWNPHTSNLLQVLVSMQSLILVPDPYFNEPGYERSRGTKAGDHNSHEYNANIRQATVKWAMLEQLRKPSACFKEIIYAHFKAKSQEITKQLAAWIALTEQESPESNTIALHLASLKKYTGMLKRELDLVVDGKLPLVQPPSPAIEPVPVAVKTNDNTDELTDSYDSDPPFLFL